MTLCLCLLQQYVADEWTGFDGPSGGKHDRLVASSVLEVFAVAVFCWCWVLEEAVDCVSGIAVHHIVPLLVQSVSVPVTKGLDQPAGCW
jgi:hypothetical protein